MRFHKLEGPIFQYGYLNMDGQSIRSVTACHCNIIKLDARNIESLPRYNCYANHKKCSSSRPNMHTEVKQSLVQILG